MAVEREAMRYLIAAAVLGLAGSSFAETINVPSDQPTIAAAISASVNGDTIAIAAGTYYEHSLNPNSKAITIGSASGNLDVTIDAQQGSCVFVINSGEGDGTVIKDLVITGGSNYDGGGIYCYNNSNPTISGCTIEGNHAANGGGIACYDNSNSTITNCTISGNTASSGGGIYCYNNSNPTITSCTISGNTANNYGGGIACYSSDPVHSGCTFSGNTPDNVYGDSDWNPLRGEGSPSIITLENCTICGTGEHVSGLIVHLGVNDIHDCIDDGDLDGDGDVDADDLNALHAVTGICQSDVNHDGATNIDDLMDLIAGWGPCP